MNNNISTQQVRARFREHSFIETETHDAVTHGRCFVGWNHTFEHVERQPFHGKVTQLRLGPMQIIHECLEHSMVYQGTAWEGTQLFTSFLPSSERISLNGRDAVPNTVTAFSWDKADQTYIVGPNESISVLVQHHVLIDHFKKILNRDVSWELLLRSFSTSDTVSVHEFQRNAMDILSKVRDHPARLDDESFRILLITQVLDMLVQLISVSIASAEMLPPPSTRSYIVNKAIQYIHTHLSDSLSMTDVSRAIRVCPRTLRYSFEEKLGVSPTQYLLAMRLDRVRCDLEKAKASGRVRCIAERYGFTHMGRFAAFYHETFGELPSETCKRAPTKDSIFYERPFVRMGLAS